MIRRLLPLLLLVSIFACEPAKEPYVLTEFEYKSKVDTNDHEITPQEKKTYTIDGVSADNLFNGARLNNFSKVDDNHFEAQVNPENTPINLSAWYSFRVYAEEEKTVDVTLKYGYAFHRYWPKVSYDRENWTFLDSSKFSVAADTLSATMTLDISKDTLWVSAQELIDTNDMRIWTESLNAEKVKRSTIGKSRLGRDLLSLDITNGEVDDKDIVLVLSRQHPPEVTGNLAMMHFLEEIINDSELSNDFLDKHRVIVYPMLNPDGVDLGHWRHNEGGIDLNRDWAYYRQPEIRQICEDIIKRVNASGGDVKLGLDFHSTWSDIYYIFDDTVQSKIQGFARDWIDNIFERVPADNGEISPFAVGSPVSKNWFYSQFNAEGITYEIGDGTPRELIKTKGQVGAQEMMKLLLNKY